MFTGPPLVGLFCNNDLYGFRFSRNSDSVLLLLLRYLYVSVCERVCLWSSVRTVPLATVGDDLQSVDESPASKHPSYKKKDKLPTT